MVGRKNMSGNLLMHLCQVVSQANLCELYTDFSQNSQEIVKESQGLINNYFAKILVSPKLNENETASSCE